MSFIATNIPPENKILQSIILPHQLRNDGYGALYSLVYLTTPWLRPERLGWSHQPFNDDMHPFEMAAIVIQSTTEAFQQNDTEYSPREQALEMLTQVMQNSTKYAKQATELIAELKTVDILLPDKDMNDRFEIINLALLLSDQPTQSTTQTTPVVNAVTTQSMYTPRKYQRRYQADKQCMCCKQSGHCILVGKEVKNEDIQICRFAALMTHAMKYMNDNKKEAARNAKMFEESNRPNLVKLVELTTQTKATETDPEVFQDKVEQYYINDKHHINLLNAEE